MRAPLSHRSSLHGWEKSARHRKIELTHKEQPPHVKKINTSYASQGARQRKKTGSEERKQWCALSSRGGGPVSILHSEELKNQVVNLSNQRVGQRASSAQFGTHAPDSWSLALER